MNLFRKIFFALLVAGVSVGSVYAGAFQIPEQDAAAQSLANAVTAQALNPSTVWYNPAGMSLLPGTQVSGGVVGIFVGKQTFTNAAGVTANSKRLSAAAPQLYMTHSLDSVPVSFGLAVNAPFGLKTDWPITAPFATTVTLSKIEGININPNLAVRLGDHFSVAGGFSYYKLTNLDFNNSLQLLHADGDGWGGNAALMYHSDAFNVGVSYRSRIKVKLNGSATSTGALNAFAGGTAPLLGLTVAQNSAASSEVTLPDMLNAGISFSPAENWRLSVDVDWVNWKTFDKLDIAFAAPGYQKLLGSFGVAALGGSPAQIIGAPSVAVKTIPENYKATTSVRVGAQWDYSSTMRARFGFAYDPSPVSDASTFSPGVPDNGRYLFAIGYGYDFSSQTTLDLAYMYVYFKNRTQTASTGTNAVRNGSYKIAAAHLVAASISHQF